MAVSLAGEPSKQRVAAILARSTSAGGTGARPRSSGVRLSQRVRASPASVAVKVEIMPRRRSTRWRVLSFWML